MFEWIKKEMGQIIQMLYFSQFSCLLQHCVNSIALGLLTSLVVSHWINLFSNVWGRLHGLSGVCEVTCSLTVVELS